MSRGTWCLVVLAVVGLSGCTDDPPPPEVPTSSAVASPGPTESASPTPTAPPLPQAATTNDAPGAEAFVQHWVDILNYAYGSGDVEALDAISLPDCDLCSGALSDIRRAYGGGGSFEGGTVTVTLVRSPPPEDDGTVIVSTQYAQSDLTGVSGDGQRTTQPGFPAENAGFVLDFIDGAWTVVGIGGE